MKIRDLEHVSIAKIACGHHSAAIADNGALYIWGTGVFGEYSSPIKFSRVDISYQEVEIGGFFGAAIDNKGLVWTWGSNTSGELGVGDYQPRIAPFPNVALEDKRVRKLSCGGSYVIALSGATKNRVSYLSPHGSSNKVVFYNPTNMSTKEASSLRNGNGERSPNNVRQNSGKTHSPHKTGDVYLYRKGSNTRKNNSFDVCNTIK